MAENNNESQVLNAVVRILDQESPEVRERILRTVLTFYDIDRFDSPRLPPGPTGPTAPNIARGQELSFADRETLSPKDFLHEKQPNTDIERVACLAYYLSHYLDTRHFKTIDISKLNTEAAQFKFSNPAYAVTNATNSGLLTQAGKGKKQISAMGERFVDALPDRDDAKAVLINMRKRRGRKKASRTKRPKNTTK